MVSESRRRRRGGVARLTVVLCCAWLVGGAAAQDEGGEPGDTPQSAMRGFLEAARAGEWEHAATFLNLRRLDPGARATVGPERARQLKAVLDRTLWIDLEQLSADAQGDVEDGRGSRDLVGTVEGAETEVDVLLEAVEEPGDGPRWRIAASTVAAIPALYREFGYGILGEYLPASFFEIRFLEMQLWQVVAIGVVLLVAIVGGWLLTLVAVRGLRLLARGSRTDVDDALVAMMPGPLRLILAIIVFAIALQPLALAVPVHQFLVRLLQGLSLVAVIWAVVRAVDVFSRVLELRMIERGNRAALSLVPLGRKTVKVILAILAVVVVVQNFGVNVTGLIAGLGFGGLALALAGQKTVENLFGGVTLIADRPVQVGDFCRFGDRVGTIEEIGLRSTRIRTLDRTVVAIPNAEFSSLHLENYTRRDRMWLHTTLGLRYETTPDQLRWVLVEVKRCLLSHPRVSPEPARVRFVGFGAFSLDLEVFAYVLTADFNEFLAIREDIYLRFMDIVAASGSGFAFPSQTIYTAPDGGLDESRTRQAEEQVEKWRAAHALNLPDVPPEVATELQGTSDYPPAGSASAKAPTRE